MSSSSRHFAPPAPVMAGTSGGFDWTRLLLWAVLLALAGFFLAPLYVMLSTSFKSMDEIREGSLLALPHLPTGPAIVLTAFAAFTASALLAPDRGLIARSLARARLRARLAKGDPV